MANDIDKTSPHYKGDFGSIYEVNKKFPTGGVAGDFVVIEGWAHYWNADRATWCVNAERDSYWDELITNIKEKLKLIRGATYMGVASLDTVPAKVIGAKMYYFATVAGTYKNFGDLAVPQGINVLYSENGSSWVNTTLLEVAQELGVNTKKVVSQKALNDALLLKANQSSVNEALAKKADKEEMNRLLATKANTADVDTKFTGEKKRVDAELDKKFDKERIAQEPGEAEDKVMSQKAVSTNINRFLSKSLPKTDFERAYIGQQDFSIDVKRGTNVSANFEVFIPQGISISFKVIQEILNNAGSCIFSFYYDENNIVRKVIEIGSSDYIIIEKSVTKIAFYLDKDYINSDGKITLRISHTGFNEYNKSVDTLKSSVKKLQDSKIDKTSIVQESGEAEDKVMSQKAVSTMLDGLNDSIANSRIYTGTSPQISAYSGAWCYVKPIYIVKGTKSRITVKSSSNSIKVSEFKLTCVRPNGTYFETNVKFKEGIQTEYIFEDTVVSVGKFAVLTIDGTFSISIETEPITNRVESLENGTNFKYPPYPIWGHEYLSAWYYKMYMSSSHTSFKIVCAGDSTTKNGSRDIYIKRLMTLRGYKDENINCLNMGVNGQQTLSWIGHNDKDEMTGETTPQYGYLHKQMQESPDLLIIGYGLNDGSNIQFPDLSFEERAANFESRLREGLGRIRTNNTYESGPSYNKSADELSIIIVTPISVSSSNNAKTEATADKWCKLINPIIKKVCRDFQCAYADFTTREYDHEWSKNWSISKDGVHPDSFIQKEMISMLSDLICPICYTVI